MDEYIDLFLQRMRSGFPEVYVMHSKGEAVTVRYNWAGRNDRLEDYQPVDAGQLRLSPRILQNMTATRNNDTYNVYMFQMTISVAHELGHFLTGFLSGTGRPVTPDEVGVPGAAGEAGYFWESLALGGIVDFFADQSDPNNVEQPGVPYIFDDAQDDARGRKVSMTWINDFVSGRRGKIPRIRRRRYANFDLSLLIYAMPARESASTTRQDLRLVTREMSWLRDQEFRRTQRANRPSGPVTGGASASSASRDRSAGPSQVSRYYY
ncbi:uncharacterized protein E0L32_007861 [Thyridium curvatum]|uniref:Uncharacterized protein n=1 Tax=Thyridium curvatum TaxID=1093900 RepID=A0A507ANF0_9PEZI|nr:uncharacterized protein E0L32_007861 [Thyridium curvatum]TPX11442.1 hypothetical protein E0L32_007861 [Thyridium curvatum]